MKEIAELRVDERFVSRLFTDNEGKKLGFIRKIELATDDSRFNQVGKLNREINENTDRSFFYGWNIRRQYTNNELASAACFHLIISAMFEPAGEECGTKYDESAACSQCRAGAVQVSDLRLDLRKVPKNKHIAQTIANEIIVSQHLAERMIDAGLTGFELRRVRHKARYEDDPLDFRQVPTGRELLRRAQEAGNPEPTWEFYIWLNRPENRELSNLARAEYAALKKEEARWRGKPTPVWHQLVPMFNGAEIVPSTRVGNDPFDDDLKGEGRCARGDLIGLNLLSEVSICKASLGHADIMCSRQFIGTRRGLLRPKRVLLISPKFWNLIESENLKGVTIEVAHLV